MSFTHDGPIRVLNNRYATQLSQYVKDDKNCLPLMIQDLLNSKVRNLRNCHIILSATGLRFLLSLVWLLLWSLSWELEAAAKTETSLACPTITVYVRAGCPHCAAAKSYLADMGIQHPDLTVVIQDLVKPVVRQRFTELNQVNNVDRPGVPTFVICERMLIGFDPVQTPPMIEQLMQFGIPRASDSSSIDLPIFGKLIPADIGLPLFTVAVGLVDGFNPCAMWVLLFLLSVLVNIKQRRRIILIAGTFVIISGLVYYAFMAAWLNTFLLIGFSRPLQLGLGVVALLIGSIHVKDFFTLNKGVSLTIPERSKPGLYVRVRRIVHAETVMPALVGAVVLATVVNLIELLCTAGLPALYTHVLTLYQLPSWQYYAYLSLYIIAYMFDDTVMVTIAVITLGHHKLQENQGRWLKLISGLVIAVLGLALVAAPQLLVF